MTVDIIFIFLVVTAVCLFFIKVLQYNVDVIRQRRHTCSVTLDRVIRKRIDHLLRLNCTSNRGHRGGRCTRDHHCCQYNAAKASESMSFHVQKWHSLRGGQLHYTDAAAGASNDRGRSSAV